MRDWQEEYGCPPRTCLPWLKDWTEWTPPSTCFEPTTMAALSLASSVGGTIAGGIGQQQQYAATAATANYQAQVARNNQIIAEQNARYASQAGRANAQAQDFRTGGYLGQARAAYGAAGVDPTTGSPGHVQRSIGQIGRFQSLADIQKAALESYGYQAQGTSYGAEAGLQDYKAAGARSAAGTALFGSILGGASSVSDKWLGFKSKGIDIFGGGGGGGGGYTTGGGPDY